MNISVLGCGRWGSFLAWYNARIGHQVINYGRENGTSYQQLKLKGKNKWVTLDKRITLSSDLKYALESSDIIIISINSQELRGFFSEIVKHDIKDKVFVLCMKGIEVLTGKRLSEVAIESGIAQDKVAVWLGPGHIQEFIKGKPNAMVIDSYSEDLTKRLIDVFKSNLIRFYVGSDIIGTEIGAAAKNIMGIIAGGLDGMGLASMKGALMSRGAREVARLIKAMGGNELSAYGLCHLGDYETTLFSEHSHNRKFGEALIKGEKFNHLAEGVATAHATLALAKAAGVDVPLTNAISDILYGANPKDIMDRMFSREIKTEFE
ncbi:MAG: glycerol-3-phosphate dehydrogenase [Firmicutes bacterium]|nr:glycerol-3-phosphate dehydrogenase [Bacillota bacterium]